MTIRVSKQRKKEHVILLPGLFEKVNGSFLKYIQDYLNMDGYETMPLEFFSDFIETKDKPKLLLTDNFTDIVKKLNCKLNQISKEHSQPLVIIGHSLGSFLSLFVSEFAKKIICFDISLHPSEMFKFISREKGICTWPDIIEEMTEDFVNSASLLPQTNFLLRSIRSKIYFIGSKDGGAKISKSYQSLISDRAEFIERDTDHDFADSEDWAAQISKKLIERN